MEDATVLGRINELVEEEHALRSRATGSGLAEAERTRLREVEEQLDQCWDLLRQRRAKEEYGQNPDSARARPTGEVESYLQ
ncbi:MAG TPA: DUF2630 family protein [Mycobacteriales bacterium]|nr:DUF2630 family protein [Mycobacteriales bacterium]